MKPIRYVIVLALVALFALAAANWAAFSSPTRLTLFFAEIEAPLGVLLLGVTVGISLLFFAYAASLRTSMLLESRRLARELEEQRTLADQAEASRFTALRERLDQGIAALDGRIESGSASLAQRADGLESQLRGALEGVANALAAHLGQLDDKVDRALKLAQPTEPSLRAALEQVANSLAAHLGQIDDKLDRALGRGDPGAGR